MRAITINQTALHNKSNSIYIPIIFFHNSGRFTLINNWKVVDKHKKKIESSLQIKTMMHKTKHQEHECRYGVACVGYYCEYKHPANRARKPCPDGEGCKDEVCNNLHPPHSMRRSLPHARQTCRWGDACKNIDCRLEHPVSRKEECESGKYCVSYECDKIHPKDRLRLCNKGPNCRYGHACRYFHPEYLAFDIRCSPARKESPDLNSELDFPEMPKSPAMKQRDEKRSINPEPV